MAERSMAGSDRPDTNAAALTVAYVRWGAVALGMVQAFLTVHPRPLGGPWIVLAATLFMAVYNIPLTILDRLPRGWQAPLTLMALGGDFLVCTAWTMLNANDIYSTTYAIYTLVAIEAATLYQWRGTAGFMAAFVAAYAGLYSLRYTAFGYGVEPGSVFYRFTMVALAAIFVGALTQQSRRRHKRALRDSTRYQSMLEAISQLGEGVVVVQDDRFVWANEAYCRLTGYSEDELKALDSFLTVIAPEAQNRLLEVGGLGIAHGGETALLRKDGTRVPVDWASHTSPVEHGYRIVGIVRDATQRLQALQLIEHARDVAEAASQAKTEHLSRMSHELRTPLTAIIGYADLLEMELHGAQRDKLEAILKAATHLLGLVNDVLDINRSTKAESEALPAVAVNAAINECVELLKPRAQARGIMINTEIAGSPCVAADDKWLRQILLNLVGNAINYNRDFGKILIAAGPREGGRIRIAITDTGPGIDSSQFGKLWEPFERLGAERTTVEGAGLGLALSKKLAEAMGGELGVDSRVGAGSTFWLELPPADVPESPGTATPPAAEPATGLQPQKTVIYVEDNLATVDVVEAIFLERPHIRLLPVMQGRLAIEMATEHRPDLLLLDVHLPDLNGDEVLRILKENPQTATIPVIVMSADATAKQREKLLKLGADRYLAKPVRVREFLRLIDEMLLDQQPQERASPA